MWICYKLEIYMDTNIHGWVLYFVCTFVFTKLRSYGNHTVFFGYQRPPYIQRNMGIYTQPDFTVSATRSTLLLFPLWMMVKIVGHALQCMCTVLVVSPVNSVNVLLYSYLAKEMEYRVFSFSWRSVLLKLIFVVCDVPTKSTKNCTLKNYYPYGR